MNWIQFVLADFPNTGLLVFLIQLFFQEQMEKRLTVFETRLSRLHQRQAEAIAELHAHLVQAQTDWCHTSCPPSYPGKKHGIDRGPLSAPRVTSDRRSSPTPG